MKKLVAAAALVALAGCGGFAQSSWNPLNWFGKSRTEIAAAEPAEIPDAALTDPRPLVEEVTRMIMERTSGGAILRATGRMPGPGYWGGELVPLADERPVNGALVYLFRVSPPGETLNPGPRTIEAARFISDATMAEARSIVVRGAGNQRRSAR